MEKVLRELEAWWPSWTEGMRALVLAILAALPGGEELLDLGVEPENVGWKEVEILGRLLSSLREASDVKRVVEAILRWEGLRG